MNKRTSEQTKKWVVLLRTTELACVLFTPFRLRLFLSDHHGMTGDGVAAGPGRRGVACGGGGGATTGGTNIAIPIGIAAAVATVVAAGGSVDEEDNEKDKRKGYKTSW